MLRVGLTGGLGSGKSTAARMFAGHGAHVLQADAIGREMMEPGQAVYAAIVARFGDGVVTSGGQLDRGVLARIAFAEGRVEELNAIVHPAVIARQAELSEEIFAREPAAVVIVESALIFETRHAGTPSDKGWKERFDRVILVTATEDVKVARFVGRTSLGEPISAGKKAELEAEARRRLAQQIPDERKSALCDYVLTNDGALTELEWQVDRLWPILESAAERGRPGRA